MRRILLLLFAGVLVLTGAWLLAGIPGRISAQIGDLTIETATPVSVLGLVVLFALLYALFRLIGAVIRLPRTLTGWRRGRHRRTGDVAVTRALVALAAGDKGGARRESARARRLLGDSAQTLLLAAEAGRLAGREDEAESAFHALVDRTDASFLGYRGLLRQAIARQDWAEAATLARQADAAHPGALWLRQECAQLAVRAGNWAEALELADASGPKAALAAAAAGAETDPPRALKLARQAWKQDASLTQAALVYAERLRSAGRESRAQDVLRHSWTLAPHPDLAACALAPVTDKLERTKAVQKLTAANPEHVESRLLLARTALEAGLTGEARHQAEAARTAGLNQRRLWLLLAEIEEEERGDTEAGRMAQRDALRRAAGADPDPGWTCSVCHTAHAIWQAACPVCATPGSLRWGDGGSVVASVPTVL